MSSEAARKARSGEHPEVKAFRAKMESFDENEIARQKRIAARLERLNAKAESHRPKPLEATEEAAVDEEGNDHE